MHTDALTSAMVDPDTGNYTLGFLAPGRCKVACTGASTSHCRRPEAHS